MEPELDETRRLLERARQGDRDCERRLFGSLEGILRDEARRHRLMPAVRRASSEDDVVHEVWLRFYASGSFHSFEHRGAGSLRGYLAVLLERTLLDMCRRAGAAKREGASTVVPLEGVTSGEERALAPTPGRSVEPSPTSHARTAELRRLCREVLDREEHEIWRRVEEDGRSAAEVAVEIGTTPASVRGVLFRARAKLLRRLADHPAG